MWVDVGPRNGIGIGFGIEMGMRLEMGAASWAMANRKTKHNWHLPSQRDTGPRHQLEIAGVKPKTLLLLCRTSSPADNSSEKPLRKPPFEHLSVNAAILLPTHTSKIFAMTSSPGVCDFFFYVTIIYPSRAGVGAPLRAGLPLRLGFWTGLDQTVGRTERLIGPAQDCGGSN